jgi:heme/copper-type cytochrome/quinol oxidase subunit 2
MGVLKEMMVFLAILIVTRSANPEQNSQTSEQSSINTTDTSFIDTVQPIDEEDGDDLGWSITSITNKVLIGIFIVIAIIAAYLLYRYYRLSRRKNILNR